MTTESDSDIRKEKSINNDVRNIIWETFQEYETTLGRLEKHENLDKKSKSITLKVDSKV